MAKYKTIKDATYAWVKEMSRVPYSVAEKLLNANQDDLMEVTPPVPGNRVYVDYGYGYGEIQKFEKQTGKYYVKMDDGETVVVDDFDIEVQRDDRLPMWGTLWSFDDPCDQWWLENNMEKMAACGFRIYQSEDYDYIFGIDGAGYDFYESHWIPLYKARGLCWHENQEES